MKTIPELKNLEHTMYSKCIYSEAYQIVAAVRQPFIIKYLKEENVEQIAIYLIKVDVQR